MALYQSDCPTIPCEGFCGKIEEMHTPEEWPPMVANDLASALASARSSGTEIGERCGRDYFDWMELEIGQALRHWEFAWIRTQPAEQRAELTREFRTHYRAAYGPAFAGAVVADAEETAESWAEIQAIEAGLD